MSRVAGSRISAKRAEPLKHRIQFPSPRVKIAARQEVWSILRESPWIASRRGREETFSRTLERRRRPLEDFITLKQARLIFMAAPLKRS